MSRIPVYQAEVNAGLAEQITKANSLAYCSQARKADPFPIPPSLHLKSTATNEGQPDLHYLETVLVSVGWNKNDDVFDAVETWVARATPEDKPFNYEHKSSDIIGHITSSRVTDDEGSAVADDTPADSLPSPFHIVTGAVLYKVWDEPELQDRMDRVLAEIDEGKWFVSMEVLFRGFDYAMQSADGSCRVVARNKETAFLTKHLRAYGGTGHYQGERVGRLLRGLTFSGKGLVQKPANPGSVILSSHASNAPLTSLAHSFHQISHPFSPSQFSLGYSPTDHPTEHTENMPEIDAKQLEDLKAELKQSQATIKDLEKKLRDADVEKVRAELEEAQSEKQKADEVAKTAHDAKAAIEAELTKTREELKQVRANLETETKAHKVVADELATIKAQTKAAERLAKVKAALKVDEAKPDQVQAATEMAEALAELSDEAFEKQVQAVAKFTPAPTAPQQADKPGDQKQTNLPVDRDKAGEKAAAGANLDKAEPDGEADLNAGGDLDEGGLTATQKSIASMFQRTKTEKAA